MEQIALTRKWRPKSFATLVGQAPTVKILTRALVTQRLHHAYLFTGTRGVGKTTIARILAKCLNCEEGISPSPCERCELCIGVSNGNCLDLIEIDAASRTKVEDTRELLEHVAYAPSRGRFKVYLIDEVHMLSGHSFNALLKTLEEPPSHVKFLLATTDPQKLPVTVLSRCLQFHLRHVPLSEMVTQLAFISEQEGIAYESSALHEIARAASGSLRDAESLLEQAILYGAEGITTEGVRQLLGLIPKQQVLKLLHALGDKNVYQLLKTVAALHDLAPDYGAILNELLSTLHEIAVAQLAPKTLDHTLPEYVELCDLSKTFLAEELQLYYQIGVSGQKDLPFAPDPKMGFEMILLRMLAFRPGKVAPLLMETEEEPAAVAAAEPQKQAKPLPLPPSAPVQPALPASASLGPTWLPSARAAAEPGVGAVVSARGTIDRPCSPEPTAITAVIETKKENIGPVPAPISDLEAQKTLAPRERWQAALGQLELGGLLKQIADNCVVHQWIEKHIDLWLDESQRPLFQKRHELELQKRLTQYLQQSITLKITFRNLDQLPEKSVAKDRQAQQQAAQQHAVQTIQADPNIQTWLKDFQAKIERIEPKES